MKRILILVSVLALQFSMGGLAIAADGDDSKPGLYLQGAFAGQAKTLNDIPGSIDDDFNASYGGSIAVGYFLTDFLALQGRLGFISDPFTATGRNDAFGSADPDVWQMQYTAGVKLYPFNLGGSAGGLLQPYAIGALGGQTLFASNDGFSDSSTAFLLELGGGLDLMFTDSLGVFGEVTYNYISWSSAFTSDDYSGNGMGWQIGVTYRF